MMVAQLVVVGPYTEYGKLFARSRKLWRIDPMTNTHERAEELLKAKIQAWDRLNILTVFDEDPLMFKVLNGRLWSLHLSHGKTEWKLPKE